MASVMEPGSFGLRGGSTCGKSPKSGGIVDVGAVSLGVVVVMGVGVVVVVGRWKDDAGVVDGSIGVPSPGYGAGDNIDDDGGEDAMAGSFPTAPGCCALSPMGAITGCAGTWVVDDDTTGVRPPLS